MTLRQKQCEFLHDMAKFIVWLNEQGYAVTSGEFERTALMAEYYKKIGKSNAGMKSLHCKRLACDIFIFDASGVLIDDKNTLMPLAEKWESYNKDNSWGGMGRTMYDYPHFSRGEDKPEWLRITQ